MLELVQVTQGVRVLPKLRLKLLMEPLPWGCWVHRPNYRLQGLWAQSLRWTKSGRRELRQR